MSFLNKIRRITSRLIRPSQQLLFKPILASSASLTLKEDVIRTGGRLTLGENSMLQVGSHTQIDADILIGDSCHITIGANCKLRNTLFRFENGAVVTIGNGVVFNNPAPLVPSIVVDAGTLLIADWVLMQAELLVRFGGTMTIGEYTGVGYGSEIRCEEKITIGKYVLISYDVCIYDTNTHSTDWQQRRQVIERMRKYGAGEQEKPETKPVYIGDDVWVGKGATILKGSVIGNRSILGIRTIVSNGVYEDDSIIVTSAPRRIQ
jgi:acetyltransferase-like isoleucine patch superfamily enzyme